MPALRHVLPFAAAALLATAVPAMSPAHHSAAMFDKGKTVTLVGTVREFQWTNPHSWIQIVVAGEGGAEWAIELGAPVELFRLGWRPATLKPGDRITVVANPMRDGTHGGLFVSAVREGGAPIVKGG
jgi:hypothetical protein